MLIGLIFTLFIVPSKKNYAHCEIPCGIYEDTLRFKMIQEHIVTIEKSIKMIIKLSNEANPNYNQIVRWVNNKEEHANKIQNIVSQYFLNQRIKPTDSEDLEKYNKYITELTLLHKMLVYSMKAKQTTDLVYIKNMNEVLIAFEKSYILGHKN